MQIEIDTRDVPVGNEVPQFIRTTVVFATWRHEPKVERVRVLLEEDPGSAEVLVMCSLRADCSDGSSVRAKATGESLFEAVHEASNRLELELFRSVSRSVVGAAQLFAA